MGDVTMNDDFLKNYKKQPRPEFARSLRLKLLQQGETRMKPNKPIFHYAIAALLIGLVSVAAVPSARAQVMKIFQPAVYFMYTTEPMPASTTPGIAAPISGEVATEDIMDLASAQAQVGFKTLLPTWLPEGFVLSQNGAAVMRAQDKVIGLHVYWESDTARIDLFATPDEGQAALPDVENSKKIEVNGQPAVLINLNVVTLPQSDAGEPVEVIPLEQTNGPSQMGPSQVDAEQTETVIPVSAQTYVLEFMQDGVRYTITVSAVSEDDLIKVAESLQ